MLPSVFTSIAIPGRGFTEGSLWSCGALWIHGKGQMSDEEVDDLVRWVCPGDNESWLHSLISLHVISSSIVRGMTDRLSTTGEQLVSNVVSNVRAGCIN